jgi:hypothetical protein
VLGVVRDGIEKMQDTAMELVATPKGVASLTNVAMALLDSAPPELRLNSADEVNQLMGLLDPEGQRGQDVIDGR